MIDCSMPIRQIYQKVDFVDEVGRWKIRWALVLFLLAIVLSVLLRYTDSEYPFGIFKLFFQNHQKRHPFCLYYPWVAVRLRPMDPIERSQTSLQNSLCLCFFIILATSLISELWMCHTQIVHTCLCNMNLLNIFPC